LTGSKGEVTPGLCLAVARILQLPREEVFRAAGMLWPLPEDDRPDRRVLPRGWPAAGVLRALPARLLGRPPHPGLASLVFAYDRAHPERNPALCETYRRLDPELKREMTRETPWLALACRQDLPEPRIIGGDGRRPFAGNCSVS
jgi:hypothetical protein